jgi:UDP:flavonoid glycosyltransferase YjiC (YdhE family)
MRVLFTLLPATGSLHPLVPLAEALARAGHEVAFCSSRSFRPEAEATGFPCFPAGLDWLVSDPGYIQILCREAGVEFPALTGKARFAWVTDQLFIGAAARRMLPDLADVARRWAPDLIVRESLEFGGCAAAEQLGLPHASVAAAADSALDLRAQLAEPLGRLRAAIDLPEDPDVEMPYRYLHLCFAPPRWDGPEARFPDTAHFLRHTNVPRPGEALPTWVGQLPDRPTVLVSLGTVFHRTPGVHEAILEGLRAEPINLLVAVGRDQDPSRFGEQPPNVRIERYVPQTRLLPRCDLFVTHGGFNSVKEALSLGIPMVVMPIAGDQPYSAERCAALGVARVIPPDSRTPDRVREAARAVLGDPSYRARAEELRRDMAALPGMDRAVALLETVAAERRPLLARPESPILPAVPG